MDEGTGNIVNAMVGPDTDYDMCFWPKLKCAVGQFLMFAPGQLKPICFEQVYSCVYKCVGRQYSERLYNDLMAYVREYLVTLSESLYASPDAISFIDQFNAILNQYLQALSGIVPIFNYMNRFYLEAKMQSDLKTVLINLFHTEILDLHTPRLFELIRQLQQNPFLVSPAIISNVMKQIYLLRPELAYTNNDIFSPFIPNLFPAMREYELQAQIEQTRLMQQQLVANGFEQRMDDNCQSNKRTLSPDRLEGDDDDMQRSRHPRIDKNP